MILLPGGIHTDEQNSIPAPQQAHTRANLLTSQPRLPMQTPNHKVSMKTSRHSPSAFAARLRYCLAGLVACAFLNACTTMQPVATADLVKLPSVVKAGDDVACTLRDGSRLAFKVTAVEPEALVGASRRLPVADIAQLEIKRIDTGKTVLLCVVIVGAAVGIAAAASPSFNGPFFSGGGF